MGRSRSAASDVVSAFTVEKKTGTKKIKFSSSVRVLDFIGIVMPQVTVSQLVPIKRPRMIPEPAVRENLGGSFPD
jgi:hypothetical protein